MAKLFSYFPVIYILTTLLFVDARDHYHRVLASENDSSGKTYTYICHPERYALMGLEMSNLVFCDSSLPYDVRAKDLVNRMTLAEKVLQLGNHAKGVARLGLPKYNWWSEALHGIANNGPGSFFDELVPGATSFPNVILSTASFNESLWRTLGEVVSTEGRAMYNLGRAGLTFWSPNINVVRDPRWGRILETPGEDPFVVGRYAVNYVRGLQDVEGTGDCQDLNSRPLKVSSCCKHFTAYDLENWADHSRLTFDARVTEQDMIETFNRPFEMCVKDGDVSSVMCSFNKINGIQPCVDPKLLNQTFRTEWDLHGYIVSDCDSIEVVVDNQHFLGDTRADAVAQGLKAGLDLDCGTFYSDAGEAAVKEGKLREEDIDRSLKYLYVVLMRLGYFDGNAKYESLGKDDVCKKEHIELAVEAARQGIVLMKNEDKALPLMSNGKLSVAVVGPHANATKAMIGNYAGIPCRYVHYEMGCDDIACKNESYICNAVEAAKKADATVIVAGIDLSIEREWVDRNDLLLPGYQTQLVNQVADAAKGPVILVIMSGGAIDVSFAKNNKKVKAIMWAGYPGQDGGGAIADIIFGAYNPGGRLPLTWYENSYVDQLPMTSMQLRPIPELKYPGRTYKFFEGPVVYPFGHGLSYTNFRYTLLSAERLLKLKMNKFQHCYNLKYTSDTSKPECPALKIDEHLSCKQTFRFQVEVKNVGSANGNEAIIVYSKPPEGIADTHIKQVVGFKRVYVPQGQSVKVEFELNVCKSLRLIEYNAYSVLPSGSHTIVIGDNVVSFPVQVSFC
ncbi:hypothetical protein K2173_001291 [Erythroxylum novogranatense]|uniref:Fibronectin type III-like domain-containing protein n=1 Tax=Erythroxylum novogranatense TaxID=1862640 RepID=A0AAV8T4Q1_9ROSI|nr:hypothetical protein K2173_001291 [Erythroxylum novogranatense]